ncbi:hypothetical protein C8A05DRAFT_38187 [Staphylotrichum tortipilum]|uniref:Uncharacterized protein n=1 Tax=Staphylotrichum tortipilum TaxID=2831512 RepID=A0AAN6MDV4_9PEZI|nr:hypothetical protein C8A05DRAFT_38187 [Staphylotrichum longicolle]
MASALLARLLPAGHAARPDAPSRLRAADHTNCWCVRALRAEEYELAHVLHEAGANNNTRTAGGLGYYGDDEDGCEFGVFLVEHVLGWASAYRALHFLIRHCWGCLRVSDARGGG